MRLGHFTEEQRNLGVLRKESDGVLNPGLLYVKALGPLPQGSLLPTPHPPQEPEDLSVVVRIWEACPHEWVTCNMSLKKLF